MPSDATIRVHDDLAPGQPGVAHRPAGDEAPGRIDVVFRVLVEQMGGDHAPDHLFDDLALDLVMADRRLVLGRDDDRIHAHRAAIVVLDRHLGLAVGPQPGQFAAAPGVGQAAGQLVGQRDGQGHQFGCFVAGEADHHTLVARAERLHVGVAHFAGLMFQRLVYALGDVFRLLLDRDDHAAGVGVEAVLGPGVADAHD